MSISIRNFTGSEPNTKQCRTERIVDDLSRCLANNAKCKYALPAGSTSTYCLHPAHGDFENTVFLDTPRNPMKAITVTKK